MYTASKTTDAARSSRSYTIRAMEAFEIPGERPSNSIPGRWWWRSEHPEMTDVLHDGGAITNTAAATAVRALDKL